MMVTFTYVGMYIYFQQQEMGGAGTLDVRMYVEKQTNRYVDVCALAQVMHVCT